VGRLLNLGITQIHDDFPELLQRSFQVFHDLLGDDVRIGEVVGRFENGDF